MNKHFLQLAERAGLGRDRWNTTEEFHHFLEQYGSLIVKECMLCSSDSKDIARIQEIFEVKHD